MTSQMLSTLLTALVPLIVVLAAWLYQWFLQRLPEKQRAALEQFVKIAVAMVEQVYGTAKGEEKKVLAAQMVRDLFKSFGLPVPGQAALDAAIEAAVFDLKQTLALTHFRASSVESASAHQET